MNIKLIIMDMDGTLLDDNSNITKDNLAALLEAQKRGIKLVLASGRSYKSLLKFGKQLQMDKYNGYFVGVNGAAIYDCKNDQNEVINQLTVDQIKDIFNEALKYDIEVMGVLDDTIYDYIPESLLKIKEDYRLEHNIALDVPNTAGSFAIVTDQRKGYDHIYFINDVNEIKVKVNKICMAHLCDRIEYVYPKLSNAFKDKYHLAKTTNQWLECTLLGINKGETIVKLADRLNIKKEEIIVFGDGENDLSMFDVAGYAIAMDNAMDSVKQRAYDITLDNNHDGIAHYLKKENII